MNQPPARRPYAATANVMAVLTRARTRNLPEAVNSDFLRIAGIPDVVFGRVMEAIKFLGFVSDDGAPTDTLRALAAASEVEFKSALAGALRGAYRDDFQNVDPSQDEQGTIIDAFRRYEPRSQHTRMVMLFLGLCREAGIPVKDAPRERKMQQTGARASKPKTQTVRARGLPVTVGIGTPTITQPAALLFGVTEDDIAALTEDEFTAVWAALGKVARARSRGRAVADSEAGEVGRETDDLDDDDEAVV